MDLRSLHASIISKSESFPGIKAGLTDLEEILAAPSHLAENISNPTDASLTTSGWPEGVQTVLVLAMHHPENQPELDWWHKNNTSGNRRLTELSCPVGTGH